MRDISKEICEAGERTVREYITISGQEDEALIPETFLTSLMAKRLHTSLKMQARVEQKLALMAKEIHPDISKTQYEALRGQKADVALYENSKLKAIIEVKVARDGTDLNTLKRDLQKGKDVFSGSVPLYGAYFICETEISLDQQIERIEEVVGGRLACKTPPIQSATKEWSWCFACIKR